MHATPLLRVLVAFAVVAHLLSVGMVNGVTVAGCGECTLYAQKVWCPSSMTCHPAENCTCEKPCMDFRDCFYTEPTCRGCVSTFGVFCHRPRANTVPGKMDNPCFSPDDTSAAATGSSEGGSSAEAVTRSGGAALPTCEDHCTGDGARCISVLSGCPSEPADKVAVLGATTAVAVSLVLAVLSISWVVRRLMAPGAVRVAPPAEQKKSV